MTNKQLPITKLTVGSVTPSVLVCGDPARARQIAGHLEQVEELVYEREYYACKGLYKGTAITVCSHGVGAPGAAIAFEELIAAGAKRLLRVGTCGGLQPQVQDGHLVIVTAAVQQTGYGRETVPPGYPAVAEPEMVLALRRAAAAHPQPWHSGIIITRDNFYPGVNAIYTADYQIMAQANVLAVEMECAALFLVGSLRGVQTGAILAVDGNVLAKKESMDAYDPHREVVKTAVAAEIKIALTALYQLEKMALHQKRKT
jgi:uridine phosphorylase